MDQIPAAMDRHLEVVHCHKDGGLLLGASSLTGRYWYGSLWYYQNPEVAPDVERCTAGVQLEAGLSDACWVGDTRVLVGMDTGGLALWELTDNLHTFIEQHSATEHDDIVSSVCVCRENNTIISASYDRSVKIWDIETFKSIHTYTAHADKIHCVSKHPSQENVFLTASQDNSVCLWDTRKPKPVSKLDTKPLSHVPTCVTWQPGVEHCYAVGSESGQLVVKDTRSAVAEHITLQPHHRAITRLQFSHSKNTILGTVSEDCSVMVLDIADDQAKQLYRSTSHKDFVQGLAWNMQNKLYTCGWDSKVYTHMVPDMSQSNSCDAGPSKMEINGEQGETTKLADVKSAPVSEKCQLNGTGDHGNAESCDNTVDETPT